MWNVEMMQQLSAAYGLMELTLFGTGEVNVV